MIKLVKDLTDNEILDYLGDNKCDYCPYNDEVIDIYGRTHTCPKGIYCYGGEPIFPICIDFDDVNQDIAKEYRQNHGNERIDI